MSIQVSRRRGLARLGALAAGLLAIVVVFAVSASGSTEVPPADGAAAVVPGDALAYVHLSTDPSRPAVKRALSLAAHLPDYPLLAAAVTNRLGAIAGNGGQVQFARDIRPWLGKEAAFALLNTATATAGSLIVLDVRNAALAHEFVRRSGATAAGPDRGVELYGYPAGTNIAVINSVVITPTPQ